MMKENSPIWARLKPARVAFRRSHPPSKAPSELNRTFPVITKNVIQITCPNPSCKKSNLMSMPEEVKKMALNTSRSGPTNRSILFTSRTSASTAPAKNAPKATLKPSFWERREIPKISPRTVISSTSSISVRLANWISRGTTRKPTTATPTRNAVSESIVLEVNASPICPVVPSWVRIPNIATARMSSTIRMPNTSRENSRRNSPIVSSALAMIVVEEMERMAPRKMASIRLQPIHFPTSKPTKNIPAISTTAATTAGKPTSLSLRKLKCSPMENISRITPSSESVLIASSSETSETGGVFGPIKMPARI